MNLSSKKAHEPINWWGPLWTVGLENCILSVKGNTHRVKVPTLKLEMINSFLMWSWRSVELIAAAEHRGKRSEISVPAAQDSLVMNKLLFLLVMSRYTKLVPFWHVSKIDTNCFSFNGSEKGNLSFLLVEVHVPSFIRADSSGHSLCNAVVSVAEGNNMHSDCSPYLYQVKATTYSSRYVFINI